METDKKQLETLVSVLQNLEEEGYVTQFQAGDEGLLSLATNQTFRPEDVKIDNFYRFEGESDPEDNSVIYAIQTSNGEKGTLIDGFSNSSSPEVGNFLKQVKEIHKQPQMTGDQPKDAGTGSNY